MQSLNERIYISDPKKAGMQGFGKWQVGIISWNSKQHKLRENKCSVSLCAVDKGNGRRTYVIHQKKTYLNSQESLLFVLGHPDNLNKMRFVTWKSLNRYVIDLWGDILRDDDAFSSMTHISFEVILRTFGVWNENQIAYFNL